MNAPRAVSRSKITILISILLPLMIGLACSTQQLPIALVTTPAGSGSTPIPATQPTGPTPTPVAIAEVTFRVDTPPNTPPGEPIQLSLLDEVTGLALNPEHHPMQAVAENVYEITIQVPVGAVLKYRYTRQGALTAQEHTSDGRPVRYRLYRVDGPGEVADIVTRWNDTGYTGPTGRISGRITDASNGDPIPNLLVAAGGAQALTNYDGAYLLEGLPPGVHHLVAYALDGRFELYQQGARVAEQATTPASFALQPAELVPVTFNVTVPEGTIPGVPVRLAGNLYPLGNTFADLSGGFSVIAARMPTLEYQQGLQYRLTLQLPAGAFVQYKYTLGDGFWNAEHTEQGDFRLRQLVVPATGTERHDSVATWHSGNSAPVWLEVAVPPSTPPNETVTVQFNPWGWAQPLPMWRLEAHKWVYLLSSPLDMLGEVRYRYCRAAQCGSADDQTTAGPFAEGRALVIEANAQDKSDVVDSWQWLDPFSGSAPAPPESVNPRAPGFIAGVELLDDYHPSWLPLMPGAMTDIAALRANAVFITPSWSFTRTDPPVFEVVTGKDPAWPDLVETVDAAHTQGLTVALFPAAHFPASPAEWWAGARRDFAWWTVWFERYRSFAMHHAGLAQQTGAETLVLGGDWVSPALPNGDLPDGTPSDVPTDAEVRWRTIISDVRSIYAGDLLWAMPYGVQPITTTSPIEFQPPPFLDDLDGVYVLWQAPLAPERGASLETMTAEAAHRLDSQLWPFALQVDRPFVIGIAYPSAQGAESGCLPSSQNACLSLRALSPPNADIPNLPRDLNAQMNAYQALLQAVDARDWIGGVVSRGYYPPLPLRDKSISIHGKPTEDLLRTWFEAWLK